MTQSNKSAQGGSSRHAVATLTAAAFSARGVYEFRDAVVQFVRQALPPAERDPAWLGNLGSRLVAAARNVCLAGPRGAAQGEQPLPGTPGPEEALDGLARCLETAAAYIDEHGVGPVTGDALVAATTSLHTAVLGIARRATASDELAVVRNLESDGAPPTLLFRLDGEPLWLNAAATRVCQRRELQPARLSADGAELARELAARSYPLGGDWEAGQSMARRGPRTDMHLRALLRGGPLDAATVLIEVVVSEARRQTRLTARELQVARLLVDLGGYQRVAEAMSLSLDSVRTYVRRVYRKLAINNQAQLRARLTYEGILADAR